MTVHLKLQDDGRVRFWQRDRFTVDDLVAYLAGATTHADMHAAMEPSSVVTPVGTMRMVNATFALNGTMLIDTFMARYPQAPVTSEQ